MDIKNIVSRFIYNFLIAFSVSFIFMYVFRLLVEADDFEFILRRDVHGLLAIAVLLALSAFIVESEKELSNRQILVRHIIHLLAVTSIIVSVAVFMGWVSLNQPVLIVLFVAAIIVAYFFVTVLEWYQSKGTADVLNQKLKERYK